MQENKCKLQSQAFILFLYIYLYDGTSVQLQT